MNGWMKRCASFKLHKKNDKVILKNDIIIQRRDWLIGSQTMAWASTGKHYIFKTTAHAGY